jgi:hypothetical protein
LEVNVPISFQPLRNNILLSVEPEPPKSSLLLTPSQTEGLCRYAKVLSVGPEVRFVKPGERVLASLTAGVELASGVVISEAAVYAHVE